MRLHSSRIITPGGTIAGTLTVRGTTIADIRPDPAPPSEEPVLDLGERWIAPGFIDSHVHGGGGAQCNSSDVDEILAVARFHAAHGTTALLATTVAAPVEGLERALTAIARAAGNASPGAIILGAHLEGPFLSPTYPGAMNPEWFLEPTAEVVARLHAAAPGTVTMLTIAPELRGAREVIAALAASGVIVSLGHTDATYTDAVAAVQAGARAVTHLFNAMRPLHHREPGVLGAALEDPQLSCELICDGWHVLPPVLHLAWRAKGLDGLRLVTDATAAAGMPDGRYRLGAAEIEVADGRARLPGTLTLAGSTLTMDQAVRNAVAMLDTTVEEAVMLASGNPARLLGVSDRKGALAPGLDADLVVLSEELRVERTMVGGAWLDYS